MKWVRSGSSIMQSVLTMIHTTRKKKLRPAFIQAVCWWLCSVKRALVMWNEQLLFSWNWGNMPIWMLLYKSTKLSFTIIYFCFLMLESGRKMIAVQLAYNKISVFYAFYFSECTSEGLQCKFDDKGKTAKKHCEKFRYRILCFHRWPTIILSITACNCIYENNIYKYNELIYNTTDGSGWCFHATCDVNGTISRNIFECGITTTPFTFSTSQPTTGMHEYFSK